jgi:Fic family protein
VLAQPLAAVRSRQGRLRDSFAGKLTSGKWAKIVKCSHDTALRDIQDLVEKRVLQRDPAEGRSTSYSPITPLATSS